MSFSISGSVGPISGGISVDLLPLSPLGLFGPPVVPELLPAAWRGVEFYMPSGTYETGRRVRRIQYPGRDDKATQDLGLDRGPIKVTGHIVGDDYLQIASDMEAALETPGPGLLVHPWRGQLNVVLVARSPFTYAADEIRKIVFEATFEEYLPPEPPPIDTLSVAQSSWEDLQFAAQNLLAAVLTTAALTVAAISTVENVCVRAAGFWNGIVGTASSLAAFTVFAIDGLATVGSLAPDSGTYAASVGALLAAPSAAIVSASEILVPAAIGPGDMVSTTTPVDPRITATAILSGVAQLVGIGTLTPPGGTVALAAAAIAMGDAVSAASDIVYTSQQDALQWQAQLTAAIDSVAGLAVTLGPLQPVAAGKVWSSCQALRAAVIADISATLGRLPVVTTVNLINSVPVWLVAQGLYGDTPSQLLTMYADLVARNDVANPADIGPGPIEALVA